MQHVEIRAQGHIDESWAGWLGGFTFIYTGQNETVLTGTVQDQAALYGLMAKLRDLGVRLIAVSIATLGDDSPA